MVHDSDAKDDGDKIRLWAILSEFVMAMRVQRGDGDGDGSPLTVFGHRGDPSRLLMRVCAQTKSGPYMGRLEIPMDAANLGVVHRGRNPCEPWMSSPVET